MKTLNRSESKYFTTAAKIDRAFLDILEKKDFAYITVKEICAKAGVNRSTFYLHYETLDDLLEESSQYILDKFKKSMPETAGNFLKDLKSRPLEELYLITPEYLTPYLNFIKEHRRIFKVSLEHASVLKMDNAYRDFNRYILTPILDRFHVPSENRKYMMSFYINGIIAIIGEWLEDGCKDPTEQIVSIIRDCVKEIK